jgi:hypothetical protein
MGCDVRGTPATFSSVLSVFDVNKMSTREEMQIILIPRLN